MDDYKFEVVWNDPEPRLEKLSQYKGVLSPQFSAYYTMPVSLQIYNTFRSRWCGAYLQSKGFTVIPTVYWGQPQSYWYCFDGIEKNSVVALSTLGVKKEKDFFLQGYNEMLRRIEPKAVICYCDPFPEMKGHVIKVDYSKTNNLPHKKTFYGFVDNSCYKAGWTQLLEEPKEVNGHYVIKTGGYVITSGFGGGGGSGNTGEREQNSKPSLRKVDNKTADRIAKSKGYKDAHDLKEDYVGKSSISKFDIKVDNNTGQCYLEGKQTGIKVPIE